MTAAIPKYRVLLGDSRRIQSDHDALVALCHRFVPADYVIYRSSDFVDSTGYMRTVEDEIDFVLGSHAAAGVATTELARFVDDWGFEPYLKRDIRHLSGGWRKFLGLALFTAQRAEGKVYFDACRQLSDRLIRRLVQNVHAHNTRAAFFLDYDALLLGGLGLDDVWVTPTSLSSTQPIVTHAGDQEANYEPDQAYESAGD